MSTVLSSGARKLLEKTTKGKKKVSFVDDQNPFSPLESSSSPSPSISVRCVDTRCQLCNRLRDVSLLIVVARAKKTIWDGDKQGLDKLLYSLYQEGLQQKAEDED